MNLFKKITELLNKLSKVAEYKINTQKSVTFLYIRNEYEEIKRTQQHFNHSKSDRGTHWNSICTICLLKIIGRWLKKSTQAWIHGKAYYVHELGDSISQRCRFSLNWSMGLMRFLSKSQWGFYRPRQTDSKVSMEKHDPSNTEVILSKKSKVGGILLPHVKATESKTVRRR